MITRYPSLETLYFKRIIKEHFRVFPHPADCGLIAPMHWGVEGFRSVRIESMSRNQSASGFPTANRRSTILRSRLMSNEAWASARQAMRRMSRLGWIKVE